jgi:hypothetical protein
LPRRKPCNAESVRRLSENRYVQRVTKQSAPGYATISEPLFPCRNGLFRLQSQILDGSIMLTTRRRIGR